MNTLRPLQQKFILHWGEMGTRWGINRTVAQIHALLYLAPAPLHAEAIGSALGVARSNVSTSLRELQNWGLVKVSHVLGDRRDRFECVTTDVQEMFRIVLDGRKKREIDPTLEVLDDCVEQAAKSGRSEDLARERLTAMRDFFRTAAAWYGHIDKLPRSGLLKFIQAGDRLRRLFGGGG